VGEKTYRNRNTNKRANEENKITEEGNTKCKKPIIDILNQYNAHINFTDKTINDRLEENNETRRSPKIHQ